MKHFSEAEYPNTFRAKETNQLTEHIKNNHSVVLIGMKRVGISNFIRFYLSHQTNQFSVLVDLNDLIERNLSGFWTLLLTRVVDAVQNSTLTEAEKQKCRRLFVQSIQLKDHFFTLDSVRKVLELLVDAGVSPTIFLLRFDRLNDVVTPEFFSNLVGLRDAVKGKMSYVFTSFRPISGLGPVLTKDMYLPPANAEDMKIILNSLCVQYNAMFDVQTQKELIDISGGYVQYLQLAVLRLHQEPQAFDQLSSDEQIALQSEELFESLTKKEKEVLLSENKDRKEAEYLWNTGILHGDGKIFSPLFTAYLKSVSTMPASLKEFTKKEHTLFTFLKDHEDELCERESIIDAVWSESKELGVSDWAIDRLVARLRSKLKIQGSPYSVVTVVTRGYKLIKE